MKDSAALASAAPMLSDKAVDQSNKTVEIYFQKSDGLEIKLNDRNLYHVNVHGRARNPSLTIYGGYDAHGPQVATSRFQLAEEDFQILIGSQYSGSRNDWSKVRCASDGKLLSSPYYRFEARISGSEAPTRKMYWQKIHDSSLGSSLFAIRDFKLMDEEDGTVLAVYNESSGSWAKRVTTFKGKIVFKEELSDEAEATAILILLTILFRTNEDWKNIVHILTWHN
jgi:hypothetical protein